MTHLEKEVQEKIVSELEWLRFQANQKVERNKRDIKNLVKEQAILKRSVKKYTDLIYVVKNNNSYKIWKGGDVW